MKEITRTSASQVRDFQACARLWFFKNVLRKRPPQTVPQARGTAIHAALEDYLKTGKVDGHEPAADVTSKDFAEFVAALRPLVDLPPTGTRVSKSLVEHRDEIPTYDGGPSFVLIVDHAREVEIENYGVVPQIDDLKTLSDFRYCKTPDELATDVQMVSYAKWALLQYLKESMAPPNFVSLRHVYVRTRGKRIATQRSTLVTPEQVEEQWQTIMEDVRAMVELGATAEDPMTVTPNTDHCSAYGGCYFRPECFGTPPKNIEEAFLREERKTNMSANGAGTPSLLDRLKARHGKPANAGAAAAIAEVANAAPPADEKKRVTIVVEEAPAAAPQAPAAAPQAASRLSRLRKATAAPPTPPTASAGASVTSTVVSVASPEVLPPDAPSRETPASEVPPLESAEAPAEPKKRGRPKKEAPATTAEAAAPLVAGVCPLEELYIDCLPVKGGGGHGLAEDILAKAGAAAAAKGEVADWRLISYTSRGELAGAIRGMLGEIPKVLVVTSSLSGADVLIEVLTPIARKVVRALRG